MHTRQPAGSEMDDDASSPESGLDSSSHRRVITSFSDDIAGMLDQFGQSDPAKELGLPPESLRSKDRSTSMDTARGIIRIFPSEQGRSSSAEPRNDSARSSRLLSPVPTPRASSLYLASPNLDGSRRTPSPTSSVHSTLPPPRSTSRNSSRSSQHREREDGPSHAISNVLLGSPLQVGKDFDPQAESSDLTLRGKRRVDDTRPLSPQSVRLISSPRPDDTHQMDLGPLNLTSEAVARSTFIASSAWGSQSRKSLIATPSLSRDPVNVVASPVPVPPPCDEEDEERGRRLACEFLENDYGHVAADKIAMFLGGP